MTSATVTPTPFGGIQLDQDEHWYAWDDDGFLVRLRLDAMAPSHQHHTLRWLRDRAEMLRGLQADHLTTLHRRGQLTGDQWAVELAALDATSAEVWLEEQPLVLRLAQLAPAVVMPERRRRFLPRRLTWRWDR